MHQRLGQLIVVGIVVILSCNSRHTIRSSAWLDSPSKRVQWSNVHEDLNSLWSSDGKQLWAAGYGGVIEGSFDAGQHWTNQRTGTSATLFSITGASDGQYLWAVGSGGTILSSTDGGHQWVPQPYVTSKTLRCVKVSVDGSRVWSVGDYGTVLVSFDLGVTWSIVNSRTTENLMAIAISNQSDDDIWIAGDDGTIIHSSDGGKSWATLASRTDRSLLGIYIDPNNEEVWVVGFHGTVLHTADSGRHWLAGRTDTAEVLHSITGFRAGYLCAVGDSGTVLYSTDNGRSWLSAQSNITRNILSVVSTHDELLAAADNGVLVRSSLGTVWEITAPIFDQPVNAIFGSANSKDVWAVTDRGVVHSVDAESNWTSQFVSRADSLYDGRSAPGGNDLWVVGENGSIVHSSDRGATWSYQKSGTSNNLRSVFLVPDRNQIWAVGDRGTILLSSDHGESWQTVKANTTQTLAQIFGSADGEQLWAVGDKGTILSSRDRGSHWLRLNTGITADLHGISGTSDANRMWIVGDDGIMLHSSDSGVRWIRQHISSGISLTSVFSQADGHHIWAVGEGGFVVHSLDSTDWNLLRLDRENEQVDYQGLHSSQLRCISGTSDGSRLWAGGRNGIWYGRAVGSYPSIATALVRSNVTDSTIEVTVPKAAKQVEFNLRVVGASPDIFKGGTEFEIPNMHPVERSPEVWTATFDPERLMSVSRGRKMHLVGLLESSDGTRQRVELGDFTYGPWRPGPVFISAMIVLSIPVTLTALTFVAPLVILSMYKSARIYQVVDQLPVGPWVAVARLFLKGTLLPIFLDNTRTLDAWVEKNREVIGRQFEAESRRRKISTYIELPIVSGSGERYDRPTPAKLAVFFSSKRTIIEISGPGGAGKTSLAFALARWALASEPALSKHRMLPIVVDEETEDLLAVIRRKLTGWLNEEIESDLMNALLRRRRLLIIFERLSEHSSATQQHIGKVNGRYPFLNAMIITTRKAFELEAGGEIQLFPQPLDSSNLLHFISGVLSKRIDSGERSQKELSSMKRQLQLASRLGELLGIDEKQVDLRDNIPVTPLFVRMYVEEAISSFESGLDLENLPTSIPEVYLQNLELLNPVDAYSNRLAHVEMHRVAEALGRLALGSTFIPGEFDRAQADNLMKELGWTDLATLDPVQRLIDNGVLTFQTIAGTERARFVLDPMAEFLAALAWAKSCSESPTKWGDFAQMLDQADRPENFVRALSAVWLTYHSSLHWADFKIS